MNFPSRRIQQRGDTIVEVLIALSVVCSVLVGAFIVTQRSSVSVRNVQEHSEVLNVLQSQVEQVRALAAAEDSESTEIFTPNKEFCIDTSTGGNGTPVAASSDKCKHIGSFYNVSVTYNDVTNIFTFKADWNGADGDSKAQELKYRIHSSQAASATVPPTAPAPAPGPPPPTASGNSIVDGYNDCGGPGQRSCAYINPSGSYRYNVNFFNHSTNDPTSVLGCSWDWGDGTVDNFSKDDDECKYNGKAYHTYPRVTNEQVYPSSCNKVNYTIVLTMKIKNVSPDPKSPPTTASMAFCGL